MNAELASFPHCPVMAPEPPGWDVRHAVASYARPSMTNQQSLLLLCASTSDMATATYPIIDTFGLLELCLGLTPEWDPTPLYAEVASVPQRDVMAPDPPGWLEGHAVAS